ncbi:MAG: GtrA family protein [Parvularculaceae bacterium]
MLKQAIKYGAVGAANTALGLALIYAGMGLFHLSPSLANGIGYLIAFLFSYAVNRRWTFESDAPVAKSFPKFVAVCAAGWLLNLGVLNAAIHFAGVNPGIAQLAGAAAYTAFVFFGSRYAAFHN